MSRKMGAYHMVDIANRFDVLVGLSDHTIDNAVSVASVAIGGCIIEKHVTLNRHGGGPDDSFSQEPKDLMRLCKDVKIAWSSLGRASYSRPEVEMGNVKFRRSLYAVKDIKGGDVLTDDNVKSIRPGFGLAPKFYDQIMGRRSKENIPRGTALKFDMFQDL